MLDAAHIAELVRQFDEIEQSLLNCPIGNKEMIVMLTHRETELKRELQRLTHEAVLHRAMH